ncbi:MAG: hypothetical protein HY332_10950, partial [Chloroflexi bacterium]|nr:hypothetical protein [Chloroflexota bacterium]
GRDGGLNQAITDMLDGKVTAREALAVVQPKIQALLDEYRARQGGK